MKNETMTPKERYLAAIRLEKTDRVPIFPKVGTVTAAHLIGVPQVNIANDWYAGLDAMKRVAEDYRLELIAVPGTPCYEVYWFGGMKVKRPGKELSDDVPWQAWEEETMKFEDYGLIEDMGWTNFLLEVLVERTSGGEVSSRTEAEQLLGRMGKLLGDSLAALPQPRYYPSCGSFGVHPFMTLSITRSMIPFTEDLYYHPDVVERAIKRMMPDVIAAALEGCKATGIPVAVMVEERASGHNYSLPIFERFWWPYTEEIVNTLWSEGITTWFHLDTPWDRNLSYFKRLPRGSAILDLDSTTNIFAAKEVLRNHLCLSGDVPAALMSMGKPEEVEAYVKKLIDEVGRGGGFVLSSGCEVPYACKPENLRTMCETGRTYELSK